MNNNFNTLFQENIAKFIAESPKKKCTKSNFRKNPLIMLIYVQKMDRLVV